MKMRVVFESLPKVILESHQKHSISTLMLFVVLFFKILLIFRDPQYSL